MIDVEKLYNDSSFNDFIIAECWRKRLDYYDCRQDIFVEILEKEAETQKRCRQIAKAYLERIYRYKDGEMATIPNIDIFPDGKKYLGIS